MARIASFPKKLLILIAGLIILILGFGVLFFKSSPPEKIQITNITDRSLTISWITKRPIKGYVLYGKRKWQIVIPVLNFLTAKRVADDHRKTETVHHVTLKNLEPETPYYLRIISGIRQYDLGVISTGPVLENLSSPSPVFGQVLEKDGRLAENIIIYLKIKGEKGESTELSTLTNEDGFWSLDLANLRIKDLKDSFSYTENDREYLFAEGGEKGSGSVSFDVGFDKPAATVKLK